MLLKKMIAEEWRKNSALYRGQSFAFFPFTVLLFTGLWNYAAINYSTIPVESLQSLTYGLILFLGLAVGAVGFSSRDAFRNILGRTNYLVFTSRTLPVSEKKLLTVFIIKDILYYSFLVLIPVAAGFLIPAGLSYSSMIYTAPLLFISAITISTLITAGSLSFMDRNFLEYRSLQRLDPLSSKSVLDISRSSGGFFKIIFSIGLLTAFYWTLVLYFPVTSIFLSNPLLSFSVILGLVGLTVYNWLNRFDDIDDYTHLPVDQKSLLKAKKQAFIFTAVPLTVGAVLLSTFFYRDSILLSIFTVTSMTVYNMAVASYFTGLKPNESLFHADIFLKYLGGLSLLLVPQLYLSVGYSPELLPYMITMNLLGLTVGLYSYFQT